MTSGGEMTTQGYFECKALSVTLCAGVEDYILEVITVTIQILLYLLFYPVARFNVPLI